MINVVNMLPARICGLHTLKSLRAAVQSVCVEIGLLLGGRWFLMTIARYAAIISEVSADRLAVSVRPVMLMMVLVVFLRVVSIRPTAAPARLIGSISNICCLTVPVGRHDPSETMASGFTLSWSSRVCRSVCGVLIGCDRGGCCLLI